MLDKDAIKRSELNDSVRRNIRRKEKTLDKQIYKLWSFTNPNGESFVFGKCRGLVVTVAYWNANMHNWFPVY